MPYWDHEGETQGIASPLCDSYNKGKMPGLSLRWTGLFSFMCPPLPQTVLKVPARVEKSVPHYRGDYEFSILTGGTFTFKTVSPRLSEKSRREQKSLYPTTGATTDSQSSLGVLLLLRQSPPDCLKSLGESRKVCTPLQGRQRILNPHWGYFYF